MSLSWVTVTTVTSAQESLWHNAFWAVTGVTTTVTPVTSLRHNTLALRPWTYVPIYRGTKDGFSLKGQTNDDDRADVQRP
jgi:hypothetical protein